MPASNSGVLDAQIVGRIVPPRFRYHQRIYIVVSRLGFVHRKSVAELFRHDSVGVDVSVVGTERS